MLQYILNIYILKTKAIDGRKANSIAAIYDRTELVLAVTFLVLVILIFVG